MAHRGILRNDLDEYSSHLHRRCEVSLLRLGNSRARYAALPTRRLDGDCASISRLLRGPFHNASYDARGSVIWCRLQEVAGSAGRSPQ